MVWFLYPLSSVNQGGLFLESLTEDKVWCITTLQWNSFHFQRGFHFVELTVPPVSIKFTSHYFWSESESKWNNLKQLAGFLKEKTFYCCFSAALFQHAERESCYHTQTLKCVWRSWLIKAMNAHTDEIFSTHCTFLKTASACSCTIMCYLIITSNMIYWSLETYNIQLVYEWVSVSF